MVLLRLRSVPPNGDPDESGPSQDLELDLQQQDTVDKLKEALAPQLGHAVVSLKRAIVDDDGDLVLADLNDKRLKKLVMIAELWYVAGEPLPHTSLSFKESDGEGTICLGR